MSRHWLQTVLVAATLAGSAFIQSDAAEEKRWAAIDPNNETSSPVMWAASENKARQDAVDACRRTASKTCASGPASTNEMQDVFAVMCCTKPRRGCAVGVAGARQEALRSVEKTFADAGYSNCTLRHYLSAATGKKD